MARPAKRYSRTFCRGMELPISYAIPAECREWLDGYLRVDGDAYHNARANPVDVLVIWRWISWDVETIQRKRIVSRRYASDLYDYAVAFDRHITGYMNALADSLPVVSLLPDSWDEWEPGINGLNFNRLAASNKLWREYEADSADMLCHIDREKVRELLRRIKL